ncbi:LPS-assembly protein LptD [Mesorhizobium sp. M3A.F.Ca.ET.174.01.1.1]|nr:LPS-assembly protein LptD [Mesorhizobium sp. M3A.F.Ca.ET.080.04.2.1]RWB84563.1 MAG: LPS-assembly protein LptD [Mesorhizobium sp.]TGS72021.1 LPS-assembly protein LptD [Mesorhizobium sp. M3A.F.Ca.ET.201.01.1.1]TGS87695.1 LPS-assembly protein LptD [Mesorhizobium sp. M3A.F.Ca.ET.175.01.1.1]TGT28154.1 LPS-assembly protein LptD [Mesorhizobium sp. M3A.F.Ca.ET.174.01.1.1]TGT61199.1 LPS-assembly protein LptD [Mesorhizobium sp. M00.F.Ca.ET.170.01.1.1]
MRSHRQAGLARLYGATALACLFACAVPTAPALAQDITAKPVPSGTQMLLAADTLVYNNDNHTVTAVGGVQIDYGGNKLVAQRVEYNRDTKRLVASGAVELINSDGTKINAEHIDITDDFADGFTNALRVETVEQAYFAAESAERMGGVLTTFHNGVYTACEPCEDKPDKAPTWRVKARKIIWNGQKKTVRFENANFEFFGYPLAYLPAFEIADPSVKHKSGFLIPGITYNTDLGVGVKVPYYFALSPTYDLTVTGTGYTKQGFLGEAEWRQRFNNGEYTLKIAGIHQQDPDTFIDASGHNVNSGAAGDPNKFRGMMGTKGQFAINERWNFGWDVLLQSDKNFSRTYNIDGYSDLVHQSSLYLTGLSDRNYFDVRAMRFSVQENTLSSDPTARAGEQPWVLPSLDYAYIPDMSVAGGQLSLNVNARAISRDRLDAVLEDVSDPTSVNNVRGIEGQSTRLTAETEWKRTFTTDGGLQLTPLLALRGDAGYVNANSASLEAVNQMATNLGEQDDMRTSLARYMATLGLEMRWPLLFSMPSSSHILEPMGQVFVRPNEQYVGGLAVPNEDAQSFVFDATTLFERDKFSGYDRMEGGTRANVGFRYSGSYDNGWATNAIFGQSYQLAGQNSFDAPDLVNAGAYSGLQTPSSDYVGLVGFSSPNGVSGSLSGRFDEQSLEVRRAEVKAAYSGLPVSLSAKYAFIQAQPLYGFATDRHEVTLGASTHLAENWRVFGTSTYDIEQNVMVKDGVGFAYNDSCFTYVMTFAQTRDSVTKELSQSVGFNLSFRTLGDFGSSTSAVDTIQ